MTEIEEFLQLVESLGDFDGYAAAGSAEEATDVHRRVREHFETTAGLEGITPEDAKVALFYEGRDHRWGYDTSAAPPMAFPRALGAVLRKGGA